MGLYIYDKSEQRAAGPISSTVVKSYAVHPYAFGELSDNPTEGPVLSLVKVTLVAMASGSEDNFFTGNGYFTIVWDEYDVVDPVKLITPIHWEYIDSGGSLSGLESAFDIEQYIDNFEYTEIAWKWQTDVNNSVYGVDFEVFYQHPSYLQLMD